MNVVTESTLKKDVKVELGDVLKFSGDFYLVVEVNKQFIAKSFDGKYGLNGYHSSLESLTERTVGNRDVTIYKKDEYQLVLEPKK